MHSGSQRKGIKGGEKCHRSDIWSLLGDYRLNAHLFKIGVLVHGSCEDCCAAETISHYLFECPDGQVTKKVKIASTKLSIPATIATVLSNPLVIDEILQHIDRQL